jgi:hypothetical protein
VEVKQYSATDELLRSLKIEPQDPQPRAIAAAPDRDRIYLLEENEREQRVRSLSLVTTSAGAEQSISDWKVDFEKKITAHKDFRIANGTPTLGGGSPAADKVSVKLVSNPLQNDARGKIDVSAGSDAEGSFLQTTDGLPLQSISDTANLTRVVLAPAGDKALDLFQDDDAVVEQFRVSDVDQIMAFDCGEIELK